MLTRGRELSERKVRELSTMLLLGSKWIGLWGKVWKSEEGITIWWDTNSTGVIR